MYSRGFSSVSPMAGIGKIWRASRPLGFPFIRFQSSSVFRPGYNFYTSAVHSHGKYTFGGGGSLSTSRYGDLSFERARLCGSYPGSSIERQYATRSKGGVTADEYIQEIQDLYEIAKDEVLGLFNVAFQNRLLTSLQLEIATESTSASTIYAASDREALREAFDDLDQLYTAYTGSRPHLPSIEEQQAEDKGRDEKESKKGTTFDPHNISPDVREEIRRRVGQRIRELRNAVEVLEESSRSE
ncbi:predicted protein [Uncinocarpus reesii 1704]|uniref:Uncharacterized protein n=1 Tax=Uncinocarpus reesii (strain UAMH 1704) TaxID=336963 RepID=C4JQV7_UNCRE|nr:uncharacterized protein UREG_03439 [Uncinocarpus reesii 1704]EEP78593.1 predicted protein [Uncinocarpus reesii 1704]